MKLGFYFPHKTENYLSVDMGSRAHECWGQILGFP